ncbi:TRAM domain protein [Natronomonas pharaonis DSM 2160]|uniref:TRAM domain protein n=1 Tax=Natronomonas pharaonis (strain ATCC 35678 / DSM 2160 / CIP 103997 / JCM 8858 / NBRC 14720 / NCIMB 2260 / Gabara) TaxID=348780 RepID=A0A1U7EVW8_NATPD|nr:hypothetical protein [Natronomonas pharaonis]CAI49212.1 TRAM domain protein [Natronomonas pharaonis DSM 2160]
MVQSLVIGGVVALVVFVMLLGLFRRSRTPKTAAQKKRDAAHREAQQRPPEEAAEKGKTYELVVKETQYDRVPPEVRGTINGLQTFVRDIPDPGGSGALSVGDTIRVQVTDYGSNRTTAQARFIGRA